MNWDILLVLDSLGFIANGIHTLDNRRLVLPFDNAGRGLAGTDDVEVDYGENGYGFASWRLGCSYLWCTCVIWITFNNWHMLP